MTSTRTLSEIAATCTKAARGAGCTWGMAEEAGRAARLLASHGLPGAETVAELLSSPRACTCSGAKDAPLCGLAEMTFLLDSNPNASVRLEPVVSPLFVVAFALLSRETWQVKWSSGSAICGHDGIDLSGKLPSSVEPIDVRPVNSHQNLQPPQNHSRPVDPNAWGKLETLAARLLVPETAQSREKGAGPES